MRESSTKPGPFPSSHTRLEMCECKGGGGVLVSHMDERLITHPTQGVYTYYSLYKEGLI